MRVVLKVQRPIVTNDPDAPWMLYDGAHKNTAFVKQADVPEQLRSAMGTGHKLFIEVEVIDGHMQIIRTVPDPGW